MATSSNDFADLVNQLHRSPNDSALKQAIVQHLPKMMALAQNNPLSLYHLAHIYPQKSSQYKHTMRQAANLGCTNAMLVMCQMLVNSRDPRDLQKAVHYLSLIAQSDDSYIKGQASSLIEEHPQLKQAVFDQDKLDVSHNHAHRFFTSACEKEVDATFLEHKIGTP